MCICLARVDVEGEGAEWIRGWCLGITNHVGTGGVLDVCLCLGYGGVDEEWVGYFDQGLTEWVVLCLCELWVRIFCGYVRTGYLYIVLGGYIRILCAPSIQSCYSLSIFASYRVFVYSRYRTSTLVCVMLSDLDSPRQHHPPL